MAFINQMAESYGIKKQIGFSYNDDKLWEQIKYSLSSFPEFFVYLSPLGNGKDGDDIYATLCSFQPLWRYI